MTSLRSASGAGERPATAELQRCDGYDWRTGQPVPCPLPLGHAGMCGDGRKSATAARRGSVAYEPCFQDGHSHDWRDCPTPMLAAPADVADLDATREVEGD